ncbi:ribokinase [Paraburkholderia sp. CNPSo 3157]|uniref:Ribokinase n=1 Tax=Paraburkholderia franconis TaxID=2654983 RepID=A0A7X1TJ31_9BURK|nr:ribokinase [Paraburkholderia franconis]MPW21135.1 ribokinase [Paraburkholderia franconis]
MATNDARGHVTVVGSLNMDLVARAPRMPQPGETLAGHAFAQVPGGKGGNQAVAAARLGAQVAMLGCVGADANGAQLRAGLEAEGIDCAALETSATAPTGVALIIVDDGSQNSIVIIAGSNGEVTPDTVARHEAALARAQIVICQLETPPAAVHAALTAARRLGKTVILNPAPAVGPLPADWLPLVDYLIPNELEAATLTGLSVSSPEEAMLAADALRNAGARNVIVTIGAQGVVAATGGDEPRHFDAPRVRAVDTTAAGDTFIGGFAAQLAQGASVTDAIRFAQRAASISVTRAGAQPSIPTRAEIEGA